LIFYLLSALIVLIDQITKWLVVSYMDLGERFPLIDGFLYFTSHRNRGAAWGMLQGQLWLFYAITVMVIIYIIYYWYRNGRGNRILEMALALLLGGAAGNFIDRLFRREVVDFIDVYIFSYDFPIFNVADSALTIGVIMLFCYLFWEERKAKKVKGHGNNRNHRWS